MLRVLWPHNFDPQKPNSMVFVNTTAEGLRACGIDVHFEYLGNLRSIPTLVRARSRLQEMSTNFDLVHAQYGSACALATAAISDIPKIVSIRGNDWTAHSESASWLFLHTRLARFMSIHAIPSFDCVVAVSNRLSNELKLHFSRSRIEVLPSAIDLGKFIPRNKAEARATLGHPGCSKRWILFNALNLNDPIKRFELAQQAFNLANSRLGDLRLQIASNLTHEQLPLVVAACDLILCTSESEGWPNSVKEALACNIPFVATDISDLGEIVKLEPSCRVCPTDANLLADAIVEVLNIHLSPNLRRHVESMSLSASSNKLVQIYESVLADQKAFNSRNSEPGTF